MPKSPYFKRKINTASSNKETECLNKTLPDYLDYDLRVLFVGINPGLTSAAKEHHWAHRSNSYWTCLSESGLVDRVVTYTDDKYLTSEFRLGITNLTSRATRKATDLTVEEQRANVPSLYEKISKYRPKVACFVGKGIYEIFSGQKKGVTMGLQPTTIPWANGEGSTQLYVMPSTSGIVSHYQKKDKLKFFQELSTLV